MLIAIALSRPLLAAASERQQKIAFFDELTFDDPAQVVREGTALFQEQGQELSPEEIIGLSVVIAESAGLYGKSETVWEWVQRGLKLIDQVDLPVQRTRLYSLAGVALEFQGKSKEAREFHLKAIDNAVKAQNLQMEAYARELFTYFANREADFLIVVQNVKRLQEIYQNLPKNMTYYNTRAAVGLFFASSFYKRYDEGIELIKESIGYFEQQNKKFLAFNYSNSLAGVYASIKPSEGIQYGLQLIDKYPASKDMPYPSYLYDSLGESYFKLENYPEALRYFLLSAEFWRSNGDNKLYYAQLMLSACRAQVKLKDYDQAWENFQKIKDFPQDASLSNQIDWYSLQAELWHFRDNPSEELKALKQLLKLTNQYHEEQNTELSQKTAAQFDLVRIEEQKSALQFANQAKTLELERAARLQRVLMALTLAILLMLILALLYIRKRHEAMEKQEALQEILDTVEEGIVRIGVKRQILPYLSRATHRLLNLGPSPEGQDIVPILLQQSTLDRDQIQIANDSLNMILGEHPLNWEFNAVHLPQQIIIGPRILSLAWQPTLRHDRTEKLILTIADITHHIELEEAVRRERQRNTEFHSWIGELRSVSLKRSVSLLQGILLQRQKNAMDDRIWIHTQKGIARSLGLKKLSTELHDLESLDLKQASPSTWDKQLSQIERTIRCYLEVAQEISPRSEPSSELSFLGLCGEIMEGLKPILLQHQLELVTVWIDDHYVKWDEKKLDTLREILVHAVTNAVDHGFIRGSAAGHSKKIRLSLETHCEAGHFLLKLRDNGVGINWDQLRRLAAERGWKAGQGHQLTALLFDEGVSTTEAVSPLSGRGIGLSAIRQHCLSLQGFCELNDNPQGSGAELLVSWPDTAWESS